MWKNASNAKVPEDSVVKLCAEREAGSITPYKQQFQKADFVTSTAKASEQTVY